MQDKLVIKGAREHNLKNINLELPRNRFIVFTGLSGSGKSSLAFDTIFAEGQRRYIESLSAYARQFLGGLQKPDVDEIEGLSPAISIDQKAHSANPRSTVATITEIYDYLRVLFARVGKPHCPLCGAKIEKMTVDQIVEQVGNNLFRRSWQKREFIGAPDAPARQSEAVKGNSEIIVLAPVVRGRKGEYYQLLYDLYNSGCLEVRVDGKWKSLRERIILSKNFQHTIEVVVDKIPVAFQVSSDTTGKPTTSHDQLTKNKKQPGDEISDTVGAYRQRLTEAVEAAVERAGGLCAVIFPDKTEHIFSTEYSCPRDGFSFPEIEPRLFSFNSPYGYCDYCAGLGTKELFSEAVCLKCEGKRLNVNGLSVRVGGKNIWEVVSQSIAEARVFLNELLDKLTEKELEIASAVLREIGNRLQFMDNVGLHYLTLHRMAGTLSGGEAQRIRLASQVGTRLVGALYVLDEPTIGLHQKDNAQLVATLRNLCDIGNTIIVVEHDEDTIRASDWVVDIGPGAGGHGGEIVYSGPTDGLLYSNAPEDVRNNLPRFIGTKTTKSAKVVNSPSEVVHTHQANASIKRPISGDAEKSLTGKYLRGELTIPLPRDRRKVDGGTPKLKIKGAAEHNLKNINVDIPLRRFVCLTGVSGSGKSTLMHNILYRSVANRLHHTRYHVGAHKMLLGLEYIDKAITIDQSSIGRTPRSNPATYTKAFDHIREIFAATPEARLRGYKAGRFSFNRAGGRCENCAGRGLLQIEMHFLPTVEVVCEVCKGRRFTQETLQVEYSGKNIAAVLDMTIEDAEDFFRDIPFIYDKLKILNEVGLDYLTLGQSATTLSGGEAQRIKLSRELAKRGTTKTLYLLDEPTTGLHYDDVRKLLDVLQRLVSAGNTVMVIEHNLDVIKCADWIIDLGPEGGDKGGAVVAVGTPEEVARRAGSYTGQYLRRVFV